LARIGANDISSSAPCAVVCGCAGFEALGGKSFAMRKDTRSDAIRAVAAMIKKARSAFIGSNHLFTVSLLNCESVRISKYSSI